MATADEFVSALERGTDKRGVLLLGVCNVTPDSFSDGGEHVSLRDACAFVDQLASEGADMIDIGGESTRPGAEPVAPGEQLARVLEVVRYASRRVPVSIDTTSAVVADACLEAGACAVNDVSCARDPDLARAAARHRAAYFLMHARGAQAEMVDFSTYPDDAYGDVVIDVLGEWSEAASHVREAGVTQLVMDPGLGFMKNARQSAELLRRTSELVSAASVPVLVGASRKSFLNHLTGDDAGPKDRTGASLVAAVYAAKHGARMLRVHDVRATRQALDACIALAPHILDAMPKAIDTERSLVDGSAEGATSQTLEDASTPNDGVLDHA
ncbi:MAG TPA: dihydropteroate synthase [Polyangiaceae bacterium]